ncbi:hypothetical protein [Thiomonas sp.]
MDEIDSIDDPAERIRRQVDAILTRRMENASGLSPASLVRVLRPVIEKHLASGMTLEDIAAALRGEGYVVTKGHLVRHLGIIRAELGMPPMTRGRPIKTEKPDRQETAPKPAAAKAAPLAKDSVPAVVPAAPPATPTPTTGAKQEGGEAKAPPLRFLPARDMVIGDFPSAEEQRRTRDALRPREPPARP